MATFRKRRSRRKYSNSKKNRNTRRIRKSLKGGGFLSWITGKNPQPAPVPAPVPAPAPAQ